MRCYASISSLLPAFAVHLSHSWKEHSSQGHPLYSLPVQERSLLPWLASSG
uniref:Uncharacterized protein n=1 Tax=Arundo donax TaxID=35708 RepID=A0A0A9TIV4_ARUDO